MVVSVRLNCTMPSGDTKCGDTLLSAMHRRSALRRLSTGNVKYVLVAVNPRTNWKTSALTAKALCSSRIRRNARFAAASSAPPTTWTLFRLWRFARPYRGMLLAGFLLTLASTAATLVAPYLTMPLMDDILIPSRMAPRSM